MEVGDCAAAAPLPLEGPGGPAGGFVDMLAELEQASKRRRQQRGPKAACRIAAVQDPGDLDDDDPIAAALLELMAEDLGEQELRSLIKAGQDSLADQAAELEEVLAEEYTGVAVAEAAPSSSGASSSGPPPADAPPLPPPLGPPPLGPPPDDLDEMLERQGLSRGRDPLDIRGPDGNTVGRMNNVGDSVSMACKRNHGKCRLWINISMTRPKHMILHECFKWIALDCSAADHERAAVAAKTALGMKCRQSR